MDKELFIEKDHSIKKIQKAFNAEYPYLKIEFFKNHHLARKPSPKVELLNPSETIGNVTTFHYSGFVNIDGKRTLAMVENDFWEKFGLSAQVFRKSGNLWIETSLTDDWTLERQNDEGMQFSIPLDNEKSPKDKIEDQRIDNE